MKSILRRLVCFFVATVCLLPLFCVAHAEVDAPAVTSSQILCYNLETKTVLWEKGSGDRILPATFTKLMTALLAFEWRAENGNVSVTVTEEMLSGAGGTSMKLKAGEVIAFDDLLQGLVVQNANDAALVIASTVGQSVNDFVEQMNARATTLGMEHSYFSNPTGVDSAVMYTTLSDLIPLCEALYRVNDFMVLSEKEKASIPATNLSEARVYTNKNALIPFSYVNDYMVRGARGMAAGYTSGAGYCVATTRQKNGATTLVLISGGSDLSDNQNGTQISSYRDAKTMLEWAEENYSLSEIVAKDQVICEKRVRLSGGVDHTILVAKDRLCILLPKDTNIDDVSFEVRTDRDVFTAPIIKGQELGEADVMYQGKVLGTIVLSAQENIGLSRALVVWDAIVRFFSKGPARIVLYLVIGGAILYVLILIATVWIHNARRNRERNLILAELNEKENRRLRKVRREERQRTQAKLRQARTILREGYRVLHGDTEVMQAPSSGRRPPQQSRAVAKVPEKYRKKPLPANYDPRRPANPQTRRNTQPAGTRRTAPTRPVRPQNTQAQNTAKKRPPHGQNPRRPH